MHEIMSKMEKKNLLFYIDAVSFAALDASLYLDTHPDDAEALEYFHHFNKARQQEITILGSKLPIFETCVALSKII